MDRKGILILVISFIALLMWPALMKKLYPPEPRAPMTRTPAATNGLADAQPNIPELSAAPTNRPPATLPSELGPAPEEELLVVTKLEARYTFTTHGGGIKLVELMDYPARVSARSHNGPAPTNWVSLNTSAPLPVMAVVNPSIEGDGVYQLTQTDGVIRAEKTLTNGLTLVKEFEPLTNHLLQVRTRLENRAATPLALPAQEWIAGTATPIDVTDDPSMLGVFWYDGEDTDHVMASWFANRTLGCFPGTPREVFLGGQGNVGWSAVHNQFFALAVVPPTNQPAAQIVARQIVLPPVREPTNLLAATERSLAGRDWLFAPADFRDLGSLAFKLRNSADTLSQYIFRQLSDETRALLEQAGDLRTLAEPVREALVADLNRILRGPSLYHVARDQFLRLPVPENIRRLADQPLWSEDVVRLNRLVMQFIYTRELAPTPTGYQASLVYPATVLAPGDALERSFLVYAGPKEYKTLSRLGGRLGNNLDAIMDFGFFGWFAQLLLLSMNGLNSIGLSYGWAIIVITIIIKILFWPLTNISTRSMKRMAALQPQMKVLQEKYKEDPQKLQRKMWEFYKEHKINPAAGCLPVLVQMPIFFGFFTMIRTAIELRGARFLWISDLSQPDTLFMIPALAVPFNLLPLIMGATMLWQARLTPAAPGVDPVQQKIMRYMPLMFLVILYNFSAGLTLYWTVQNLLSIVQTKLTRTNEPQQPVAVPAKPVPVAPQKRKRK